MLDQTLHIFRKDIRLLWFPILLVLALTVLNSWNRAVDAGRFPGNGRHDLLAPAASFFLVLSWWFLIAAALYQERPTGDRQFWTTRPYRLSSLLGAKLLLVLACINLPFLVSDIVILASNHLSPVVSILLLRQVTVTGLFLLPAAALAAVTRHMTQMVLAALLTGIVYIAAVEQAGRSWGTLEGSRDAILIAVLTVTALLVVGWQYTRRNTWPARALLGGGVVLCFAAMASPPPGSAFPFELPADPHAAESLHLVGSGVPSPTGFDVRIDGVPSGLTAKPEMISVHLQGEGGARSSSGMMQAMAPDPYQVTWRRFQADGIQVDIGKHVLEALAQRPDHAGLTLALTLYRNGPPVALAPEAEARTVAGVGLCRIVDARAYRQLLCLAAEPASAGIQVGGLWIGSRFSRQAIFNMSPIFETVRGVEVSGPVEVTPLWPVVHIRRELTIPFPR